MARPIEVLSEDILLNIFCHYLDASAPFWFRLAHVCRTWRQIVFASPLGLGIRLHLDYGGLPTLRPPTPEDEDNIIVALGQSDRVYSISFTLSSSLLEKLSTISKPFSELEELVLLSQEGVQSSLPSAFWWGHRLRTLHSTRIAFPSLPQLLLPSQDLVDLQLHEIPGVSYFSPEAFANALCGMTQLESLSLHFLSLPPRRKYLSLPPLPVDRIVLPALTSFKYRGISKYLDNLVARIDAPSLGDIDITFFNQPTMDASQLGLFINRVDMWGTPLRVDILSSGDAISTTFSQPGALPRLGLQISCKQLDWQISTLSQICDHFRSFTFGVEDLRIAMIGPSSVSDDVDDEHWPRLLRAFDGAEHFGVAGELATGVLNALRLAEAHKIVHPALKNLYVEPMAISASGAMWDSVKSFYTQRRLSSHPVQIYVGRRGESIHVTTPQQQQQAQVKDILRSKITQGLLTRERAQERLDLLRTSAAHAFQELNVPQQHWKFSPQSSAENSQIDDALTQHPYAPASNPINPVQRFMQTQDILHTRQLHVLLAQSQQQQNNFASRVGQNLRPPGMGFPQGQGLLQQNYIQPSPSVLSANLQPSAASSASQPAPLGGQQIYGLLKNFIEMPWPQVFNIYGQLVRDVEEGKNNFSGVGSTDGGSNMQLQALRARTDLWKQLLANIWDLIILEKPGGDPAQQAVNGAPWLGAGQGAAEFFLVPERPLQHNSPLHQASANQIPPQRSIPTPQENFGSSVTAQTNLTQISPHLSGNGLPFNSALSQMPGAPPQPPPPASHPSPQQAIQCGRLPPLPEDRFKALFSQFSNLSGLRLNDRDFIIDGQPVNPWALHSTVFARNGFDSVTANDDWPAVGAALGFPPFSTGNLVHQPLRCAPAIAHRLQQLYNDSLPRFEKAYINSVLTRLRNSQALSQMAAQPSQQQAQPHQPTDADYQALLASIPQGSFDMSPEAMRILQRFLHTSGADLEAYRFPSYIVAFMEQHRAHLQRTVQDQNELPAGLTSTTNPPLDNRAQINQVSTFQDMARVQPQVIPNHAQLQYPWKTFAQTQGTSNVMQPIPLINDGVDLLARLSTAQSMGASSLSSMGTQITGADSNGRAQSQSGPMSAPLIQSDMNSLARPVTVRSMGCRLRLGRSRILQSLRDPSKILLSNDWLRVYSLASSANLTPSFGAVLIRRPTAEEVTSAKRWVDEQKKTKVDSLDTPVSVAPAVASTPASSTFIDVKGGVKRAREDEVDGTTPGIVSAPSPKRVKSDWESPPNEDARKRNEQAEDFKTNGRALAFFENVTKFINENPESAEAAFNAMGDILRTLASAPENGNRPGCDNDTDGGLPCGPQKEIATSRK